MADVRVVYAQDNLVIRDVQPVGVSPPLLRLRGKDFHLAETVLLNGIRVMHFMVLNSTELLAEIPDALLAMPIRSVAVLSQRSATLDAVLSLRLDRIQEKSVGLPRLVQRVVLMLLTDPGSDLLHPTLGGGLRKWVGKADDEERLRTTIVTSIDKVASDLRRIDRNRPPLETLSTLSLGGIRADRITRSIAIRLVVQSAAGEQALSSLFF